MKTKTKTGFIAIPALNGAMGGRIDPQNKKDVRGLIAMHKAAVALSKKAWEDRNNDSRLSAAVYAALERRERRYGDRAEALLAPLGIKCDWPGLYPSFTVMGFGYHDPESAVLAALGHPMNWLCA